MLKRGGNQHIFHRVFQCDKLIKADFDYIAGKMRLPAGWHLLDNLRRRHILRSTDRGHDFCTAGQTTNCKEKQNNPAHFTYKF